ncbi:MAG: 3-phosphoshikimate 1-carboxyvinyltransferase [Candidatus Gastranaerophilaceae bacterium]
MNKVVNKVKTLKGTIVVPGDKSVSHRAVMFSALTRGKSLISGLSTGKDCRSTIDVIRQSGCTVDFIDDTTVEVSSDGILKKSEKPLYCGNSGTSMRLFSGIFAGQNFETVLTGDDSLSKRPMKRVIEPISAMGAKILHRDFKAPLNIFGGNLHGINYVSKIASAQVKSAVLAAGLFAEGETSFTEPFRSRNHSELMLKYLGADIEQKSDVTTVIRKSGLIPQNIEVCGDISSAAYFIVAALITPGADILIKNVGVNSTRTGILDVVKAAGGNLEILNERILSSEPVADLRVKYTENLKATVVSGSLIPRLIDEIPVIALLAALSDGQTVIKDAEDLKNKESDRIKSTVAQLSAIGADIVATDDGMIINGKKSLEGGVSVDSGKDHRTAMTLYTAGLVCRKSLEIRDFEWVDISFPEFERLMSEISIL